MTLNRWFQAATILVVAVTSTVAAAAPLVLEEVQRARLHGDLARASDVRVEPNQVMFVSARGYGVARVPLKDGSPGEPELLIVENRSSGIVIAEHLGVSSSFVAVASPLSQLIWSGQDEEGGSGMLGTWGSPERAPISFFEDIDVLGNRLAILGLMRSDTGMSPDGAIAWTGELGGDQVDLEPLAYAKSGKGARPFDACATFVVGKIRFLSEGRIFLLPGAEPGAYLYSAAGKLERSWDTAPLGLDMRCDFDDDTLLKLGSDTKARLEYVNRFITVDDVLPTAEGPGLLLRKVDEKGTSWRLALLRDEGGFDEMKVPVTSDSPHAHLRGDVLGERLFLVLRYFERQPKSDAELIELRFGPPSESDKDAAEN